MISLPLILNIALLVTLSVVQQLIVRRWREDTPLRRSVSGVLFGLVAIVVMRTPLTLAPGVIFDGRSIILGIAGLFGGTLVAVIASLMAAAYRIYLGGAGAVMGVLVITESALLGLAFRQFAKRDPRLLRPLPLWLLGLAIHVVMILMLGFLPGGLAETALRQITLPVLILYPLGFVLVAQLMLDQEQRLVSEDALRESEERYRAIMQSAPFGMYLYRLEGDELVFATSNPAAEQVLDHTRSALEGVRIEDAFPTLSEDGTADIFRGIARDGGSWHVDSYTYQDDRISGTFEVTAFQAGKGTVAISFNEVSEKIREAEELRRYRDELRELVSERTSELEAANERLKAADEAKTRFLRAMSHELRTPLNSVIGFSDLLARGLAGELNEEQSRQIAMINSSGRHLLALINDVLDLSRIEAQKLELHIDEFDAVDLVKDVMGALLPGAAEKQLEFKPETRVDRLPLVSDRLKVRQILLNLVGNAIKFTESGSVTLGVDRPAPGLVAFTVADTGPGIPYQQQEAVFGEFVQGEDDEAPREGTGLGLAISRGLALALGGSLDLVSAPGAGSTFTLTIPESPASGIDTTDRGAS